MSGVKNMHLIVYKIVYNLKFTTKAEQKSEVH